MSKFSILLGLLLTVSTPVMGNPSKIEGSSSPPRVLPLVTPIPDNPDGQRFQQIMKGAIALKLSQKPLDEIMGNIAQQFLGSAYQGGLLDKSEKETLVASLTQFDCVLFVETVLALVRGIAVEDYTYSTFTENLVEQRYRQGKMETYCDRLHYFSEWIVDNEKRGKVVNLTPSLGGIPLKKTLNFMTTHRGSYPQMVKNEANYQCIAQVEENLRQLNLTYLPTSGIEEVYSQLKSGDIIAITTKIKGLDVTHTGLVYRQANQVGLIHASPAGQVTLATDLQQYVSRVPQASGIFVVRPVTPRFQ